MAKTVVEYLNEVDYSVNSTYVPSQFALEVANVIKLIEGGNPENKTPVMHLRMLDNFINPDLDIINMCHRGAAKALSLDTKVITTQGYKLMRDIKVGDTVLTREGRPTEVTHVSKVFRKSMYLMTLVDGRTLKLSKDHLNIVTDGSEEVVLTTKELVDRFEDTAWYVPTCNMIDFDLNQTDPEEDPYKLGLQLVKQKGKLTDTVKFSSSMYRIYVLRGIMDVCGLVYGKDTLANVPSTLTADFMWLVRSLGFNAFKCSDAYDANVVVMADVCPFLYSRSTDAWDPSRRPSIQIRSIEPIEKEPSKCIAVADKTHSFLVNDFIVTHNTTLKEYLIWTIALYGSMPGLGKVPYLMYVTDSEENGVKKMRSSIESRWERSDFLREFIPEVKITDTRWQFKNRDGHVLVASGSGARQKIRGSRERGERPVLALLDDLISEEDARSPTIMARVEAAIYEAFEFALHPKRRRVIWSGTPYNASDPLYKAIESGAWAVNVYPVCEKFPCTKEEFRGSWEERFDYDSIKKRYTKLKLLGKLNAFNQELMLRIMADDERLIVDRDIQWYNSPRLIKNRNNFNFYITTDFATTCKDSADYSVISVWALNNTGNLYWIDGICARQDMACNIDDLFRLCQKWQPMAVGVEVTGQQGGFIPWLQNEMMDRNVFFTLASEGNSAQPGIRPRQNKLERFNVVVPWFKQGKMYFPDDLRDTPPMVEAYQELSLASAKGFRSKHDDFIDTISMLAVMPLCRPGQSLPMIQKETGVWDLEDYPDDEDDPVGFASYIV